MLHGGWFPLYRIDFHTPAEHLLQGDRHPLEMHLVHRDPTRENVNLVLALLFWCENAPGLPQPGPEQEDFLYLAPSSTDVDFNAHLQHFLQVQLPHAQGESASLQVAEDAPIRLADFLVDEDPESSTVIEYVGSLTTPPCSDQTTWLVRRKPLIASDAQVATLAHAIAQLTGNQGNYRHTMPVNQRFMSSARMVENPSLRMEPRTELPWGANPRTDGELEAARLAHLTRQKTDEVKAYVDGFWARVKRGARAELRAVQPHKTTDNAWPFLRAAVRSSVTRAVDAAMREESRALWRQAAEQAAAASAMVPPGAPAPAPVAT